MFAKKQQIQQLLSKNQQLFEDFEILKKIKMADKENNEFNQSEMKKMQGELGAIH